MQKIGVERTVRVEGQIFADAEAMKAAGELFVEAEEIVPESVLRRQPDSNVVPSFRVEGVVEVLHGVRPTGVYGYYDMDAAFPRPQICAGNCSRKRDDSEMKLTTS